MARCSSCTSDKADIEGGYCIHCRRAYDRQYKRQTKSRAVEKFRRKVLRILEEVGDSQMNGRTAAEIVRGVEAE